MPGPGPFFTTIWQARHYYNEKKWYELTYHREWHGGYFQRVLSATPAAIAITFKTDEIPRDKLPPIATISANPLSIKVGQTTTIDASFIENPKNVRPDPLTRTEIQDHAGNVMASVNTSDPTSKDIIKKQSTFSSSTPGDYTFSAWIETGAFPTLTRYAQVTVTVTDPDPTHTLTTSVVLDGTSTTIPGTVFPAGTTVWDSKATASPIAIPNAGFAFSRWSGDVPADQTTNCQLKLLMGIDRNVVAHFIVKPPTTPVKASMTLQSGTVKMQNSQLHSPNHIITVTTP